MQFRYDPTGRFDVLKSQRAQFVSQILGDFTKEFVSSLTLIL